MSTAPNEPGTLVAMLQRNRAVPMQRARKAKGKHRGEWVNVAREIHRELLAAKRRARIQGAIEMTYMPWPSANDIGRAVYSNEYLDFFADRWIAAAIGIRGVTLMQYLANPKRYDNMDKSLDPLPLNAKQRRVRDELLAEELRAKRLEAKSSELPRRNGRVFEKLKHHAHPKSIAGFIKRSIEA